MEANPTKHQVVFGYKIAAHLLVLSPMLGAFFLPSPDPTPEGGVFLFQLWLAIALLVGVIHLYIFPKEYLMLTLLLLYSVSLFAPWLW